MYFISSRANVDDLKSIENKSDFVATENMPNYVKAHLFQWRMSVSINIMALI